MNEPSRRCDTSDMSTRGSEQMFLTTRPRQFANASENTHVNTLQRGDALFELFHLRGCFQSVLSSFRSCDHSI